MKYLLEGPACLSRGCSAGCMGGNPGCEPGRKALVERTKSAKGRQPGRQRVGRLAQHAMEDASRYKEYGLGYAAEPARLSPLVVKCLGDPLDSDPSHSCLAMALASCSFAGRNATGTHMFDSITGFARDFVGALMEGRKVVSCPLKENRSESFRRGL